MITDFVDAEHYVRSALFDMELQKSRCVQVSCVVLFVVPIKLPPIQVVVPIQGLFGK